MSRWSLSYTSKALLASLASGPARFTLIEGHPLLISSLHVSVDMQSIKCAERVERREAMGDKLANLYYYKAVELRLTLFVKLRGG